jgi:hypothetical protein
MSPLFAAMLALVAPRRGPPEVLGAPSPLDVDRLSDHLRRDLGLADGRDRPDRGGGWRDV